MASAKRNTVKNLLIGFTIFYALSGIGVMLIGLLFSEYVSETTHLDTETMKIVMVITGIVAIIMASMGGFGAIKDKGCMLKTFGVFMSMMVALQIMHGLLSITRHSSTQNLMKNDLNELLNNYSNNRDAKTAFDLLQQKFKCCGVNEPTEWKSIFNDESLPCSCCPPKPSVDEDNSIGAFDSNKSCCKPSNKGVYNTGCLTAIVAFQTKLSIIFGIFSFVIILFKIIAIYCAFYLVKTPKTLDILVVPLVYGDRDSEKARSNPPPYEKLGQHYDE